jgi:hypothetical protein
MFFELLIYSDAFDEAASLKLFMQEPTDIRAVLYGHFIFLNNRLGSLFKLKLDAYQLTVPGADLFIKKLNHMEQNVDTFFLYTPMEILANPNATMPAFVRRLIKRTRKVRNKVIPRTCPKKYHHGFLGAHLLKIKAQELYITRKDKDKFFVQTTCRPLLKNIHLQKSQFWEKMASAMYFLQKWGSTEQIGIPNNQLKVNC